MSKHVASEGHYRCGRCQETKPSEAFAPSQRKTGAWCRDCFAEWHRERAGPAPEPRPCEICGKQIEKPNQDRQRFCSKTCKQRSLYWRNNPREQRQCPICGTDITNRRRDTKHCSDKCANEARRRDGRLKAISRKALLTRYGLTQDGYDALLADQGGGCAICGSTEPKTHHGKWHIDHDHGCCPARDQRTCGKCVRGLLCQQCNLGLGHFEDDPAHLEAAIRYLRKP